MLNLFIVFFLTLFVAFLLIFFIKRTTPPGTREQEATLNPALQHIDFNKFYNLCIKLLEKLGLKIKDSYRENDFEADVYAENPTPLIGGPVIAHLMLYPENGLVSSMDVMNFASNLVGERRGKGLFITTGSFAPEVWTLPELPPMEFIDGKYLGNLLTQYGIVPPKE
jgi:hypothetical protein